MRKKFNEMIATLAKDMKSVAEIRSSIFKSTNKLLEVDCAFIYVKPPSNLKQQMKGVVRMEDYIDQSIKTYSDNLEELKRIKCNITAFKAVVELRREDVENVK